MAMALRVGLAVGKGLNEGDNPSAERIRMADGRSASEAPAGANAVTARRRSPRVVANPLPCRALTPGKLKG